MLSCGKVSLLEFLRCQYSITKPTLYAGIESSLQIFEERCRIVHFFNLTQLQFFEVYMSLNL